MKYSKLFGKTSKTEGTDYKIGSHRLLVQAGFIRESTAGRYYLLPLGIKVHDHITQIVRKHMNAASAQEVIMPVLHPIELWKETNRTNTAGFELMTVKDRRDAEFALGGTAEEMAVDLVRKFNISYKDLPLHIYQFSMKFRDEMRARGGLLRVREFVMKDGYSFSTEEQFKIIYEEMGKAYTAIFKELGLKTDMVAADNGYIGGEYCHEFIAQSSVGESRYFVDQNTGAAAHEDVAVFKFPRVNPNEELREMKIIEQPEGVRTMEEFMDYYKKDKRYFLKNVVYKNVQGDIIIATIRGDLEVNKTKLEQKLGMVGQLENAEAEDLSAIGTKTGYVHSWGHQFVNSKPAQQAKRDAKIIYVADESLKTVKNFIGGQKEENTDSIDVNYGRDFKHEIEADIAMAQAGVTSHDGGELVEKRGIEVGNIFQLGYHYSTLMKDAEYTDEQGQRQKYYMGCYGIGIGRTLAAIVEAYHDNKGIMWPANVAPYQVYLASVGVDKKITKATDDLYELLQNKNIKVLYDDRDVRPGEKFSDADLIGIPVRVVVSPKTLEENKYEFKLRQQNEAELLTIEQLLAKLT